MAVEANISWFIGEDLTFTDTITGVNITGWAISFKLEPLAGGTDLFTKTVGNGITLTTPVSGIMTIAIAAANTSSLEPGRYRYEIARTDAGAATVLTYGYVTLKYRP